MEFYVDDFKNYEHLGRFYTEGDVEEPEDEQAADNADRGDGQHSGSESDIDVLNVDPAVAEGDDDALQEEDISREGRRDAENQQDLRWSQGMSSVRIRQFSENSGPQHSLPLDATPLDYFSLLWPESLFETITEETNRYAEQRMAAANKKDPYWVPTTVNEIRAFFALAIMMGIKNLPRLYCYWAGNMALRCDWISGTMSHSRYVKINQYLHVRDNKSVPHVDRRDYDPIFKVRNVVEAVRENFGKYYYPHCEVAVDEGMIPFKGRLFFKQHMPAKPTKWGVKVWELCESETGYCLNFDIYTGRNRKAGPTHGLGHQVVMSLTEPYWHRNHHVYFDRFFSSPRLLEDMLKCSLYGCSTININRVGLPDEAKQLKLRNKGDVEFFQKGNLVLTVWRDKRVVVTLASNAEGKMIALPDGRLKPDAIMKYNKYMGGVDRSDQYRSYYHVGRTSKKWWRYIIWFLMNLSIVNAWLLYRESKHDPPPPKGYDHFQFRIELAEQLRAGFSGRCQTKGRRPKHGRSECYAEAIGAHRLVRIPNRKRVCRECSQNGRKTRSGRQIQTSFRCGICDLPLCRARCFREYHKSVAVAAAVVVDVAGDDKEDERQEAADGGDAEAEEDDVEIVSVNGPNAAPAGCARGREERRETAPLSRTPTPSEPCFDAEASGTGRSVEAAGGSREAGVGTEEPSLVDRQNQASAQPVNPVCGGSAEGDSGVAACGTSTEDDDLVIIVESSTAPPVTPMFREKRAIVKVKTRKRQRKSKSASGQTTKKDVSTSTSVDASEGILAKGTAQQVTLAPAILGALSSPGNAASGGGDGAEAADRANEVIVIDFTDEEEDNDSLQQPPPPPPPPPPAPASKRKKKRPKKRRSKKVNAGGHKKSTTQSSTKKRKSVIKEKVVISNQRKGAPRACKAAGVGVYQDKMNYYAKSRSRARKQAPGPAVIDLTGDDDVAAPESSADVAASTPPVGHLGDSDGPEVMREAAHGQNENTALAAAAVAGVANDGDILLKEEPADQSLSKGVESAICHLRENVASAEDESEVLVCLLRDDAISSDAADQTYPQQKHTTFAAAAAAGAIVDSKRNADEAVVSGFNMKAEREDMATATAALGDIDAAEMERIRRVPHAGSSDTSGEKEANARPPEEATAKDAVRDGAAPKFGEKTAVPRPTIKLEKPDACEPVSGSGAGSGCTLVDTVATFRDADDPIAKPRRESPSREPSSNGCPQRELHRGQPEASELIARGLLSPQTVLIPEGDTAGMAATQPTEALALTRSVGVSLSSGAGGRCDVSQDVTIQTRAEGGNTPHSAVSNNPYQGADPKGATEQSDAFVRCRLITAAQTEQVKRTACSAAAETTRAADAVNVSDLVSSSPSTSSLSSSSSFIDAISKTTPWTPLCVREIRGRMGTANLWRTTQTHTQNCICFNLGTLHDSAELGADSSQEEHKITATTDADQPPQPTAAEKEKSHHVAELNEKLSPMEIDNDVILLPIETISSTNSNVLLGHCIKTTNVNQVRGAWAESSNLPVGDILSNLKGKATNSGGASGDNHGARTATGEASVDKMSRRGDADVSSKVSDKQKIRQIDKYINKPSPSDDDREVTSWQGSKVNRVKRRRRTKPLHGRNKLDMTPIYIDDDDDDVVDTESSPLNDTRVIPTTKGNAGDTPNTNASAACPGCIADAGTFEKHKCYRCNNPGHQESATECRDPNIRKAEPSITTREDDLGVIYIDDDDDDDSSALFAEVSASRRIGNVTMGETLPQVRNGDSDRGNWKGLEINMVKLSNTSEDVNLQAEITDRAESREDIDGEKRPRLGDKIKISETDTDAQVAPNRADNDDALPPDMDNRDDAPPYPSPARDVTIAPSAVSRRAAETADGMGADDVRKLDNASTTEVTIDAGDETSGSPDKCDPGEHPHVEFNAQSIEADVISSSSLSLSVSNISIKSTTESSIAPSAADKGSKEVMKSADTDNTTNMCNVQNKTNTTRATADVEQTDRALPGIIEDTHISVACTSAGHAQPESDDGIHSTHADDAGAATIDSCGHVDTTPALCTHATRHDGAVMSLDDAATTGDSAGGADATAVDRDDDAVNAAVRVTASAVCLHAPDPPPASGVLNPSHGSRSQQRRGIKRPATDEPVDQRDTQRDAVTGADVARPCEAAFTVPSDAKRACIRHEHAPERDTGSLTKCGDHEAVSPLKIGRRGRLVAESVDSGVCSSHGDDLSSAFIAGSTRDDTCSSLECDGPEPSVDSNPSEESRGSIEQNDTCMAGGNAGDVEERGSNDEALGGNEETLDGNLEVPRRNDEAREGNDERPGSNEEVLRGKDEALGSNTEALGRNEASWCNVKGPVINDDTLGGNNETPRNNEEVLGGNDEAPAGNDEAFGSIDAPGCNDETPGSNDEALGSNGEARDVTKSGRLIEIHDVAEQQAAAASDESRKEPGTRHSWSGEPEALVNAVIATAPECVNEAKHGKDREDTSNITNVLAGVRGYTGDTTNRTGWVEDRPNTGATCGGVWRDELTSPGEATELTDLTHASSLLYMEMMTATTTTRGVGDGVDRGDARSVGTTTTNTATDEVTCADEVATDKSQDGTMSCDNPQSANAVIVTGDVEGSFETSKPCTAIKGDVRAIEVTATSPASPLPLRGSTGKRAFEDATILSGEFSNLQDNEAQSEMRCVSTEGIAPLGSPVRKLRVLEAAGAGVSLQDASCGTRAAEQQGDMAGN